MKQKVTLNGVEIEIDITKEMARKVLEESEGIQKMDVYWYIGSDGSLQSSTWMNHFEDEYRQSQDNCLPCKNYTEQQAQEYFDKRDARRAAEYRIKKAIEKMDVGKKKTCEVGYHFESGKLCIAPLSGFVYTPKHLHCSESTARYMLEHHAEDYMIYFGIE